MDAPKMMIDAKLLRQIKRMKAAELNAYLYKVRLQGYNEGFKAGIKTREAIEDIKSVVSIPGTERS